MTWVCFVRHGQTDWNRRGKIQGKEDIPLNETGKDQARFAGEYLKNEHWDVLVSSPLKRAKATAEIIGKHVGISDIIEMEEFCERGYGAASGMTKEERNTAFPNGNIPNRESEERLRERVMKGLQTLLERYPGKRVLVVAHGGVIHAILAEVSKGEISKEKIRLENASLHLLHYLDDRWMVKEYNVISHLDQP